MTHSHNNCDSSPSPAASYNGGCGMSASSSPPMLELPPRRSPPFLPLPPPAALLLTPKLTLPQLTMPQPQRTNSRFSPPLAIGVGQQQQLPPLPHLDTSVLARMQPPPPPAVIAAAVLARAASLATKKFGPLQPQTSPRLPQLVSPHMMPQSTSPAYQSSFSGGHTSSSPPAPAALALPPPRVHDDGGAKSADNGSSYTGPDCGDSGGPSFTLPASSYNAYNDRRQPPSSRRWANDTHRAHTSRWDDRAPRHQQQPQQQPTPGGPRRSSRWENRGGGNEGAAAFGSGPSRSSRFSPVAAAQDPRIGGGREHYPSGGNSSSSSPPLLHCLRAGRDQRPPPSLPHYHHPQAYSGDDSGGGFRRRHDGDMRDFDESEPPRKRHRVGFAARFDDGYRTRETGFRPYHHPPQPNTFAGDRYHSRGGGGGGSQWHDDQEWYSPSDYRPSHHGGHQRPPSSKSHHGGRHHPATSSYHYPARHRRRSHRFSSGGGKHRSVTSSSSSSKSGAATRKDAPGTAACHSLSVVRVVTEGSMFPIEANQRLASEAPNQASRSHNDNSGDRLKTSATIIKVEPSPSPAPERTPLILSPMSIASSSDDIDALSMSDFSCDETVIMSDDESEHEDSDSESSVVKPFVSNTQSLPIAAADSDDEGALPPPPPPLFIVTTSLDDEDDAEDDESSSNESSSSSSWEGEFGDDPALPFYAAPTFAELCGCGGKGDDDPTDGWIVGLSRNELDERLRARRLVSSYSELQNPEVVRSHIRPLTHDLRNLLATLSHAKSASVLHKDDEAFVSSFRNHLGDSARMMQRGLPYIGSLYA